MKAIYAHVRFADLDLDAMSLWVGEGKQISVACSRQLSKAISVKLATTAGHVLQDLDFANVYIYGFIILLFF